MGELPRTNSQDPHPPFLPLGGHEYVLTDGEGPDGGDVVHLRVHGAVELNDIKLVLDLLEQINTRHQRVFLIVHMVGAGGFSYEARRWYINWRKEQHSKKRWVYIVGTTLVMRTLVTLVVRGVKLLTGFEPAILLVATQAEASAHIAAVRARSYR